MAVTLGAPFAFWSLSLVSPFYPLYPPGYNVGVSLSAPHIPDLLISHVKEENKVVGKLFLGLPLITKVSVEASNS